MSTEFARLVLAADTRQMRSAAADIDKVTASGEKADRMAAGLAAGMSKAATSTASAASMIDGSIRGLSGEFTSAQASAEAMEREMHQLRLAIDPLYAASKQYETHLGELDRALRMGAISAQQHSVLLEQANRGYMMAGVGAMGYGNATKAALAHTTNLMFQFQDIAMMLAAGQNPLMLAMQQGTQVSGVFHQMKNAGQSAFGGIKAGLLAMVSPMSLLTIGVIAGGAALVQWGMGALGAKEEADQFKQAMDSLNTTMNDASRVQDILSMSTGDLVRQYGSYSREVLQAAQNLAQLRIAEINQKIRDQSAVTVEAADAFFTLSNGGRDVKNTLARISREFGVNRTEAVQLEAAFQALATAGNFEAQKERLADLRDLMAALGVSASDLPPELRAAIINMDELSISVAEAQRIAEQLANTDLETAIARGAAQATRLADEMNRALNNSISLAASSVSSLRSSEIALQFKDDPIARAGALALEQYNAQVGKTNMLSPEMRAQMDLNRDAFVNNAVETERNRQALIEWQKQQTQTGGSARASATEIDKLTEQIERLNDEAAKGRTPFERYNSELARLGEMKALGLSDAAYSQELERMNEELANSLPMVNDVANAFGDFIAGGLKDFKGFVKSILGSFTSMLSQMIAAAARNKIMFAFGGGGSIAGTAASAATGGGNMLGSLTSLLGAGGGGLAGMAGAGGIMGGVGSLASGLGGVLSGGGLGASFANLGGLMSGAVGGLGAVGAAIPAVGVILAAASFLKKSKKELDSGLNVDVSGGKVNAQTFSTVQTKRFWGLSSKTRTSMGAADPAISSAVGDLQASVQNMAAQLGVGAEAFNGFSASFRVSLKGLSEDQAAQAVAAEMTKLGDSFARMIPHISSVQELMAVTEQRFGLETRLLQLQGDTAALRERELTAVHHYNKALAEQIFALEDAQRAAAERFDVENRLLTLQGAETEVLARNRQKELDAIDATNRAMLEQVYALEDQAKAMQAAADIAAATNAAVERTMDLFRAPLSVDSERFTDRFSATLQAAEDRRAQVQKESEDAQLTELKLMRSAMERLVRETRDTRLYGETA